MHWLPPLLIPLLIAGVWVYVFKRRNGERARNAPLRGEIEAQVCFETILYVPAFLERADLGASAAIGFR